MNTKQKKALYESIMSSIAKEVKASLNGDERSLNEDNAFAKVYYEYTRDLRQANAKLDKFSESFKNELQFRHPAVNGEKWHDHIIDLAKKGETDAEQVYKEIWFYMENSTKQIKKWQAALEKLKREYQNIYEGLKYIEEMSKH